MLLYLKAINNNIHISISKIKYVGFMLFNFLNFFNSQNNSPYTQRQKLDSQSLIMVNQNNISKE